MKRVGSAEIAMTEEKSMTPENDGVLTVEIDGTEHEYSVPGGTTVTFRWDE